MYIHLYVYVYIYIYVGVRGLGALGGSHYSGCPGVSSPPLEAWAPGNASILRVHMKKWPGVIYSSIFNNTSLTLQARRGVSASEQAAVDKFVQKDKQYKELCASRGADFLPIPVCAFGGLLESSQDFLATLADRLAEHTGLNRSVAGSQLWQRISVKLWAGNAKMVLQQRAPTTSHWLSVSHLL